MSGAAEFYDNRRRRLWLHRAWKDDATLTLPSELVLLIGLNPSFADADVPDHTTTVEVNFAHAWGFQAMTKVNLFDWISTDPSALAGVENPEGDPKNLEMIVKEAARAAKIVCCWGDDGLLRGRASYVRAVLEPHRKKLFCLGFTKKRQPRHTSRLAYATALVPMWVGA